LPILLAYCSTVVFSSYTHIHIYTYIHIHVYIFILPSSLHLYLRSD
jgi:hypothetical protein